jgi:Protein of unknown function (DUF3313)
VDLVIAARLAKFAYLAVCYCTKEHRVMRKLVFDRLAIVFVATILGACANGGDVSQTQGSGFLRDYSVLQQVADTQGRAIRAWASPKFTPANYDAILLDPLVFYPEPRPSDQVSAETLQQIIAYSYDALRRSLGERFKMADRAGPSVARLRIAFAGVAAQGAGLRTYQLLPVAFVATMAVRAVAGTPQQAFVVVESEVTDSLTGVLLGQRIEVGTGARLAPLAGEKVITLSTVQPLLDELVAGAYPNLAQFVRSK